ncbi:unnamed protein product, partial [Prunus brigantina]
MYEDLVLKVKNIGTAVGLEEKTGSERPKAATWLLAVSGKEGQTPLALGLEHGLILPSSQPDFVGLTSYSDSFGSLEGRFGAWAPLPWHRLMDGTTL